MQTWYFLARGLMHPGERMSMGIANAGSKSDHQPKAGNILAFINYLEGESYKSTK
jgi:hypothetical protein